MLDWQQSALDSLCQPSRLPRDRFHGQFLGHRAPWCNFSTSAGLTNGILGGYAYFNGSDFATLSGSGPFTMQAYSGYVAGDFGRAQYKRDHQR